MSAKIPWHEEFNKLVAQSRDHDRRVTAKAHKALYHPKANKGR